MSTPVDHQRKPLLTEIVDSIFTPSVNGRVQLVIHGTFGLLQFTLILLLWLSDFNGHAILLNLISAALWLTLTWFIQQLEGTEGLDKSNFFEAPAEAKKQD